MPYITLGLFSVTLLVSASLMFAVQPMVGKMLLPVVGGTPAGWIVAMAFFQTMLLSGYLLAHVLSRFSPRIHGILFTSILAIGIIFLPVYIIGPLPRDWPVSVEIFKILFFSVGFPFTILSATSSTVQRLFTATQHSSAKDPYFLYAASNLGSFAGLLLYPLLAEPLLDISMQSQLWLYGYSGLVVFSLLCITLTKKTPPAAQKIDQPAEVTGAAITGRQRLNWILLAFMPSSLLMAVTTHITTEVFSAPMLWVLPLGIYLLTFVVAFSKKPLFTYESITSLHPIAVCLGVGTLFLLNTVFKLSWYGVLLHLFTFGIIALLCHMRLAQERPQESQKYLTEYYLMISIGGALGGILNAFILPNLLDRLIEYPIFMILSLFFNPAFRQKMSLHSKLFFGLALFCILLYVAHIKTSLTINDAHNMASVTHGMIFADLILFSAIILLATNVRAGIYGMFILLIISECVLPKSILLTTRNFFGVVKVAERELQIDDKMQIARYIEHGTTIHGLQLTDPDLQNTPTAYYYKGGPVDDVFSMQRPEHVAVIGLGAGTINCYNRSTTTPFLFIEIDQGVADVAQSHFTFMEKCAAVKPELLIGDGRLELVRQEGRMFDMILIDAFSSDSIPTHLLTLEALAEYKKKLNPGGLILINISNRYFNLNPILAKNADVMGMVSRTKLHIAKDISYGATSMWFTIAPDEATLAPLDNAGWEKPPVRENLRPWTDTYSNLLSMLEF
jgi:spermidine synthase